MDMQYHNFGCLLFSLWSEMETRSYTIRDVFTAIRWV